jgi:hypothetical protein
MPNPSERGIADITTATDAELQEYANSPDKLLGCAVRDEIKRRKLAAEQGTPGPASPELCEALGINADDLKDALPSRAPVQQRRKAIDPRDQWLQDRIPDGVVQPGHRRVSHDPQDEMLKRAAESLAGESVKTKEAVVTTVATYLANKEDNWWMQPASFREKEMFFVVKFLVHTYSELERA